MCKWSVYFQIDFKLHLGAGRLLKIWVGMPIGMHHRSVLLVFFLSVMNIIPKYKFLGELVSRDEVYITSISNLA